MKYLKRYAYGKQEIENSYFLLKNWGEIKKYIEALLKASGYSIKEESLTYEEAEQKLMKEYDPYGKDKYMDPKTN